MRCPECDHDIAATTVQGESANACVECGGIWLETDELRPFFERIVAHSPKLELDDAAAAGAPPAGMFYKSGRNCPACGQQMEKNYYAYDSGILIEHCVPCAATWVDASKIDQLAAYIRDNAQPLRYADDAAGDEHHKKALLADLRLPSLHPVFGLIIFGICYVLFLIACYNLYHVGMTLYAGRASHDWVETQGTLQDWTTGVLSTGAGRSRDNIYFIRMRYTYHFQGRSFAGDATWPNGDDLMVRERLKVGLMQASFVPGGEITVYVDPGDPQRSSLRRGTNPFRRNRSPLSLVVVAIASGLGMIITATSMVKRRYPLT